MSARQADVWNIHVAMIVLLLKDVEICLLYGGCESLVMR